jgi:hypothetical protein
MPIRELAHLVAEDPAMVQVLGRNRADLAAAEASHPLVLSARSLWLLRRASRPIVSPLT